MSVVTVVAPAKVTLSLRITGVRDDGYHLIDAEMVTVDLHDTLTFDDDGNGVVMAGVSHEVSAGPDNLVSRALRATDRRAAVRVTKRIPAGAGLGGGSADAAAVLRWADRREPSLAVSLGADVPFCVVGGRARVRGIGEIVEPLAFEARTLTLVTPEFGCSTPEVYAAWDRMGAPVGDHGNDLEPAALAIEPRLAQVRDHIIERTGVRPRLAGSGSTWFLDGAHDDIGVVVTTVPAAG